MPSILTTGVQLTELTQASSLLSSDYLLTQRLGSLATKITLSNLDTYFNINSKISTALSAFSASSDPLGDRAYSNNQLHLHAIGSDPHGDRAAAAGALTTHTNAADPHGDRAYTNTQINNASGTTLAPLVAGKVPSTYLPAASGQQVAFSTFALLPGAGSSNILYTTTDTGKIYIWNSGTSAYVLISDPSSVISSALTTASGTTLAPLVSGKVPNTYLPTVVPAVAFSTFALLPAVGVAGVLYIDTDTRIFYKWDTGTSAYVAVSLTSTDQLPSGSNADRKYFTAANAIDLGSKIDTITTPASANLGYPINNARVGNTISLKNIAFESPFSILDTGTDLQITDNRCVYGAITDDPEVVLDLMGVLRTDPLSPYDPTQIYHIKGTVYAFSTRTFGGDPLVSVTNEWTVDARLATVGVTVAVDPVTSSSINNAGDTITGDATANNILAVYDETYTSLGTTSINSLGHFSKTLGSAITNGTPLYLYNTTSGGSRSAKRILYSPNLTGLKDVTNITISTDGLTVKGIADRNVTVTLKDNGGTTLGTDTTTTTGNFTITVGTALVVGDTIKFTSVNALGTTDTQVNYVVAFTTVEAPSYVKINNARSTISGTAPINSDVHLYDASSALITTFTADGSGNFSGTLTGILTTDVHFKLKSDDASTLSSYTDLIIRPYVTLNPEPVVIDTITSSSFDFIYKDITQRNSTTYFSFDVNIDTPSTAIQLIGTNNTIDTVNWTARLTIDSDTI